MKKGEAFSDVSIECLESLPFQSGASEPPIVVEIDTVSKGIFGSFRVDWLVVGWLANTTTVVETVFKLEHSYDGISYEDICRDDIIGPANADGTKYTPSNGIYAKRIGDYVWSPGPAYKTVVPVCYVGGRRWVKTTVEVVTTPSTGAGIVFFTCAAVKTLPTTGKATSRYYYIVE